MIFLCGGVCVNKELRDKNGQLLGKTKVINGVLVLRDNNGELLGRYDPRTNKTRDSHGSIVGTGNLLQSLL